MDAASRPRMARTGSDFDVDSAVRDIEAVYKAAQSPKPRALQPRPQPVALKKLAKEAQRPPHALAQFHVARGGHAVAPQSSDWRLVMILLLVGMSFIGTGLIAIALWKRSSKKRQTRQPSQETLSPSVAEPRARITTPMVPLQPISSQVLKLPVFGQTGPLPPPPPYSLFDPMQTSSS